MDEEVGGKQGSAGVLQSSQQMGIGLFYISVDFILLVCRVAFRLARRAYFPGSYYLSQHTGTKQGRNIWSHK